MTPSAPAGITDSELVATLPGFTDAHADVDGVRLHYVTGGRGDPLVLLPSWPQTWWEFHQIMPRLAERYRVLAVDLRGMGSSSRPPPAASGRGYDKKTMAADVRALVVGLGLGPVHIVGNDVGSMVAYSFAANHPESTRKLVMLDAPHPFPLFQQIPVLPAPGTYDLDNPARSVHPWWFAFNQIPGLAEVALQGRYHVVQDWIFDYMAVDKSAITPHDRAVYAAAYESPEARRAVTGWFASFATDIEDAATYAPLTLPTLGLGGFSFDFLAAFLSGAAPKATVVKLPDTGHWIPDERPDETVRWLLEFLG
jgi:pimeloyl-ACP methyl ester carboxylesterase